MEAGDGSPVQPPLGGMSKSSAVIIQSASKLVGVVLQFLAVRFCLEWLGPQYNTYLFAASCAAFLGLFDFGLPGSIQRYMGQALALNDLPRVAAIYRFGRQMHAIYALLGMSLYAAFAIVFALHWRSHTTDPQFVLLLLCGLQMATTIFYAPALTMANALERFREVSVLNVISGTITPALGIAAVYFTRVPEALAATTLLGAILTGLYAFRLAASSRLPAASQLDSNDRRQILGLGVKGYPMSIMVVVGNNADRVMVGRAGIETSLTAYSTPARVPEQLYQIIYPITTTVYPELTRLAPVDEDGFCRAIERNIRFTLALSASFLIVPCALSECILRFWLHSAFVTNNPGVLLVLPLMGFYKAMELVYGIMTTAYYAKGIPQCVLPFAIFNATTTVVATVPMFRWLGITGVALMNASIDFIQIIPMVLVMKRFAAPRVRLLELFSTFGGILGLAGVLFAFVHYGLDKPLSHFAPVIGFALAPAVGFAAMFVMTRLRLCPVPPPVAARLLKLPGGRFLV